MLPKRERLFTRTLLYHVTVIQKEDAVYQVQYTNSHSLGPTPSGNKYSRDIKVCVYPNTDFTRKYLK